jgi:hypothetical protein
VVLPSRRRPNRAHAVKRAAEPAPDTHPLPAEDDDALRSPFGSK